ncbi:MAG: class IV adenylate cyclase [Phycisphaerae bacterium]
MAQEIEAKFRLDNPAVLRARLDASGARRVAHVLETNRIFDTGERKLLAADCALRLRTCRSLDEAASPNERVKPPSAKNRAPSASAGFSNAGIPVARAPGSDWGRASAPDLEAAATLTYKGPRNAGLTKTREEVETVVADADATATILQRLGFNQVIVYEKRRETWQLEACEVCLDKLPKLGWFVEIAGPTRADIEAVRERLELPATTALGETYVDMAATHGDADPTGVRRLQFET